MLGKVYEFQDHKRVETLLKTNKPTTVLWPSRTSWVTSELWMAPR